MKLSNALFAAVVLMGLSSCQEETRYVEMISSTMDSPWQKVLDMEVPMFDMDLTLGVGDSTLVIDPLAFQQTIEGFGACFNELGWTSLSLLSQQDRDSIFRELYAPGVGANFTMNRNLIGIGYRLGIIAAGVKKSGQTVSISRCYYHELLARVFYIVRRTLANDLAAVDECESRCKLRKLGKNVA